MEVDAGVLAKLALDIYNNLIIKEDVEVMVTDINILITHVYGVASTAKIDDHEIDHEVVIAVVKDVVIKLLVHFDKYEENKRAIENIDMILRLLIPVVQQAHKNGKCGCCLLL